MNHKELFLALFNCSTEEEVQKIIDKNSSIFRQANFFPLGGNQDYYGVIENQQASPIAALIEKITNSIDAILIRKALETGDDPESVTSPRSMQEAVEKYFPKHDLWDSPTPRKEQSLSIQILADGQKLQPTLTIFDEGEGQHPAAFETTLLSMLKGNKKKIAFVQGKYNMGGTGALIFCGKKRFQLVCSRRFDGSGEYGFTLVRQYPLSAEESETVRNTWYEYLKIDGAIPSFKSDPLDLGLHKRTFNTGTVLKLYSYDLPPGSRSVISRDLNQSINEFLFEPALPLLTVDRAYRYPNDRNLERDLYGLKRRLEQDDNKYIDTSFSEEYNDSTFGRIKVTVYVFKPKVESKSVKETRETIQSEFFKNNMSVMFSINGQVHGSYTSEFITRSLKYNLLKDYCLVHVDCTQTKYEFRKELFMASRDRLKNGESAGFLRDYLSKRLRQSQLDDINRYRKESIGLESEDTNDLIKSFAKNLPKDSDLLKLLANTLKLEDKSKEKSKQPKPAGPARNNPAPFKPQRFPTFFKYGASDKDIPAVGVPLNGEKVLKFATDVENTYFDRVEEPGHLKIAILNAQEHTGGGSPAVTPSKVEEVLNVVTSSPHDGTIKVTLNPTQDLKVGDQVQLKVSLSSTGSDTNYLEQLLWIKISDPEKKKSDETEKKQDDEPDPIGLPKLTRVYKKDWDLLAQQGVEINYKTVINPIASGEVLEEILVNMDSSTLLNYKAKMKNPSEDQLLLADKRYVSSVYFHTLFLYMITKKRNYRMSIGDDTQPKDVDIASYIKDVFDSYYSEFLLNFGMEELLSSLG